MKQYIIILLISVVALNISAQTSLQEIKDNPAKAGGVYYAYPVTEIHNTPAPKGYRPFYISHYGRHGSRYLISDNDYKWVLDKFRDADSKHALTSLGSDVLIRLDSIWQEGRGRGGELSPLGSRQHHDIADRMYKAYPDVFTDNAETTAVSTVVMRCAHSMFAFVEGLKENNPRLKIPRESSQRNMDYLNYHSDESGKQSGQEGEWYQEYKKFYEEQTQPDRLMNSLFTDSLYVRRHIDPAELMNALYWIAVDMQNMETKVDFFDIFTSEELFNLWQIYNYSFYATNSSYPPAQGLHVDNAKNLLRNIVSTADKYISEGKTGATLRFGHDGNIIPLVALLRLKGKYAESGTEMFCYSNEEVPARLYESYSNFKISPMAANLQIVFFKNKKQDVIVKFLLNEQEMQIPCKTDIFPFYSWKDVRATLMYLLNTPYIKVQSVPSDCLR